MKYQILYPGKNKKRKKKKKTYTERKKKRRIEFFPSYFNHFLRCFL